jgi:hypothetical protein
MATGGTLSGQSFIFKMPTFGVRVSSNVYADALSGDQRSPEEVLKETSYMHPDLFDSSHPLAFDNAQNTAQASKDQSQQLQEAHTALTSGDFMQNLTKSFKGFNQSVQNSTANIAPYGFHTEGRNQVRNVINSLAPMPAQGLPVSKYDTSYSGTGTTEMPEWQKNGKRIN